MRALTLLAFVSFLLFSCQKEVSTSDTNNNNNTDTSALGKFVAATKITDGQLKANLDSLITNARNHGWWNLCKAIYPLVGGSSETCKYNLKDPRDADVAYRITWNGNVSFDNAGVTSTGGYGDTHIVPSSALSLNSNHISYYSLTDNFGTSTIDVGAEDPNGVLQLMIYSDFGQGYYLAGASQAYYTANPGCSGYFLGTRTSDVSSSAVYKNGMPIQLDGILTNGPEGLPNISLDLLNENFAGHTTATNRKCAFATIGSGIDSSMAGQMYIDIQAFQTVLGRDVH